MHAGKALIVALLASFPAGCNLHESTAAAKPAPPAHVEKPVKEAELATITLDPEAEKRLGIAVANVERKAVVRTRSFGGEVVVPSGRSAIVTAPFTGAISNPPDNAALRAGQRVKQGQPILRLQPLLNPPDRLKLAEMVVSLAGSRIEADGLVEKASITLDAARVALNRAEQLLRDKAGSAKVVDEAKAQVAVAESALKAAQARQSMLERTTLDAEAGSLEPVVIPAPEEGVLQSVQAIAGQIVSAGVPLFEVVRLDIVWIRVPVYVGHLANIAVDRDARVLELAATASTGLAAQPITAPPSANSASVTADLYYELKNPDEKLRPGQRVIVVVPLHGDDQSLVVPQSSIVHDVHGNAWVYERIKPQTFLRRRVQVLHIAEENAVLSSGPSPGAEIVVQGAAELFGTELGFAK
jgi:cobalt-zinc-cadmium efflux system membrane fusion protein